MCPSNRPTSSSPPWASNWDSWAPPRLLLAYGVVSWRVLRTAQLARDNYGRLLCSGIFALLVFSVFENVGMNMGIMPVTGIPLPFLSYGGSATVGFFAAIGIVISVHVRSVR